MDSATHIRYTGLVNFTNGDATGPASGNCLVNSLLYNEAQPLQVLRNCLFTQKRRALLKAGTICCLMQTCCGTHAGPQEELSLLPAAPWLPGLPLHISPALGADASGLAAQETIGEVMQLDVENIDVHPYHHHTQPYQIVALDNDTAAMDASWRVRSNSPCSSPTLFTPSAPPCTYTHACMLTIACSPVLRASTWCMHISAKSCSCIAEGSVLLS